MFRKLVFLLLCLLAFSAAACSGDPEIGPPLEGEVADLAETFIANLDNEDYAGAVAFFNAEMKRAMSERKLKQTWEGLNKQMGLYLGEVEKEVLQVEDHEVVNVLSDFEKDHLIIRVVFDSDNRVAGLWFLPVE